MILSRQRVLKTCSILGGGVCLAALLALVMGSVTFTPGEVWSALLDRHSTLGTILFDVRLPRVLLGLMVGAGLSLSGACYQALLRNPLADPYVLGISSGAALGVIVSLIVLPHWWLATPIAGLLGALFTTGVVYMLGYRRGRISGQSLLLAGVIVASFLSAIIVFLMTVLGSRDLRSTAFWLMGDLSLFTGIPLHWVFLALVAAGALAYRFAPELNLLLSGEEEAEALGVAVGRTKLAVYIAASALTAVAVAAAGSIGFIGLLVPHIVRMMFGSDYRLVMPASALAGAIVLVAADTAARTVAAPTELPVGAFTALAGAPLFIYLLRRRSPE